jgi:hypothetical protein
MKLLINASTLSSTGVTQVAISFIEECKKFPEHTYFVLMSKTVALQLATSSFPKNFSFYEISIHPRFLIMGHKSRKDCRKIERMINPDCVFSVFGPSYWTPQKPHLMGYAYPHYVYPDSPIYELMSIIDRFRTKVYKIAHRFLLKKNGKFFVCETEDVAKRATRFLNCAPDQVFTVSNTYNEYFNNFTPNNKNKILPNKMKGEYRFLVLCSFAAHKNLEILNKVIPLINIHSSYNRSIRFVLTVDEELLQKRMTVEAKKSIINLGRVNVKQCPQLYYECDALFLPTLLECLSANYPEAMKMKRPILTSNLPFATTVCKNAALYFDPLNPEDIAEKIFDIVRNQHCAEKLVANGEVQLGNFNKAEERARKYLLICDKIRKIGCDLGVYKQ